ncbi:glutamate 5-kinase [Garciella nitratireducens]|uniref:glutamate 5-kinase n=1 Tax=Garciella nitratireducens TaxID=218205 RepID=UPI001BD252DC|nr:glutamate 5-kinase [Garciella nitratireducens]
MDKDEIMQKSRKIVIKIGTNTLSDENGFVNKEYLSQLAYQVNELKKRGKQVVLVSSGARIAGVATLGKWALKEEVHYKQALCAIGQVELMDAYRKAFFEYGIPIGQILFTKDDFSDSYRILNIRNTLFTLIDEGVIPIVNENDSVSVEEIKIGDNDTLAAYTAHLWNADLLILLSDIDGIYNKNPKEYKDAVFIEKIEDVNHIEKIAEIGDAGSFGTGGMHTKIQAAKLVNKHGIPMILANGEKENIILNLLEGKERASVFLPKI